MLETTDGTLSSTYVGQPRPCDEARKLIIVNASAAQCATPYNSVKIMSYNVLADRYVTTEKYFHCPAWALGKEFRSKGIAREVAQYNPDIACFQELTREVKEQYLDPYLSEHYASTPLIQIITRTCRMFNGSRASSSEMTVEGVAIYYNKMRFDLVESVMVSLDEIPTELGQVYTPSSHNVALLAVLRSKSRPSSILLCSTVHLFFGWERTEIQIGQLKRIDKAMTVRAAEYSAQGCDVGCTFTGDLNAEYQGETVCYVRCSMANGTLRSAYEIFYETHPSHVTAISASFRGTIDYVWYDSRAFEVADIVETVKGEHMMRLPSPQFPSDHVPVICTLVARTMVF